MPRMRTINEAFTEIKAQDSKTSFTKTALRQLVISGKLPSVKIGNKYLVCMETLEKFLYGEGDKTK